MNKSIKMSFFHFLIHACLPMMTLFFHFHLILLFSLMPVLNRVPVTMDTREVCRRLLYHSYAFITGFISLGFKSAYVFTLLRNIKVNHSSASLTLTFTRSCRWKEYRTKIHKTLVLSKQKFEYNCCAACTADGTIPRLEFHERSVAATWAVLICEARPALMMIHGVRFFGCLKAKVRNGEFASFC